jgi:hypothetical protein
MRQLRGIELRYVLTMQLSQNGPTTIVELIETLGRHGFFVRGELQRHCRMRCVGRSRGAEYGGWAGVCTRRGSYRTQLNTGSSTECEFSGSPPCCRYEVDKMDTVSRQRLMWQM